MSAGELAIGSGIHADEAWEVTLGDPRVVIAVLDSGIRWNERDLVNKFYLNRGELPVPDAACGTAAGSDPWDVNGDGVFNVQDYTTATGHAQPDAATICDSRVTDTNGNGFLDPEDLITAFSDGTDDDDNGWTDDIAGWDAFHDDNDPFDDTDYGHGTGEAKDSTAEGDNGMGDIGVCPTCLVMPVRVGDSFVADSNDFALGVTFAVDTGATIVQEALGTINGTPYARAAVDYAWKNDVPIVASAADENSFHANLPGSLNHTIYVHANTYNTTSRDNATTFLAFNNCTNYGANLLLSTPGGACSSEATGKTAGVVGLIEAAALANPLLSPSGAGAATDPRGARVLRAEEIKQLLIQTVDDIYDPTSATDPDLYLSLPGWDKRFGYGRTNVRRAVDEVLASRIPPVVDVWQPAWFDVIDPATTPTVMITGELSYRHDLYTGYDYVVEWAPGIEPGDADWHELASGSATDDMAGGLASWDVSSVVIDNAALPAPDVDVDRYMVTVRVRVTLHSADSSRDGVKGEIRRAFHIEHDDDLRAGFPVKLAGSGEPSATITDLDGDGVMDLVYAEAGGIIHVLGPDGQEQAGWPVSVGSVPGLDAGNPASHRSSAAFASGALDPDLPRQAVMHGIAVGDLDGDGPDGRSVVAATYDGEIYAYGADGALRPGFPVTLDRSRAASTDPDHIVDSGVAGVPVLEDLDGDGALDIVVAGMDGSVYAWHGDGTAMAGFPVALSSGAQQARIVETPSVGDIDGDGFPEIVVGTNEDYNSLGKLYAVRHDGTMQPGWPVGIGTQSVLPVIGTGLPNSTALADIDGDGVVDVAASGVVGVPKFIAGDGSTLGVVNNAPFGPESNSDDQPSLVAVADGSFGDLDGDGKPDMVWAGAGISLTNGISGGKRVLFDHQLDAWNPQTGDLLPGFPRRVDDHQFFMNPAVADFDGDGKPEVISGSGGYYLHAWNVDGVEPAGWPKFTGGWIISAPAVGDLDGDGLLDVVVATREGYLWAWKTQGEASGHVDWASYHHDDRNTGNLAAPLGFPTGGGGGGCCSASGGDPRGAVALALVALVGLARPRLRRGRARG